jgi:DNA-binding CsgD family transcriptional regulator
MSRLVGRTTDVREKLQQVDALTRAAAVIMPNGKIEHIQPATQDLQSLQALTDAVRNVEHPTTGADLGELRDARKERVHARWTLVQHLVHDGRRYILAQENERRPCPVGELSSRERQVMTEASMGHSNKEIAYSLGLANSTVRVLLARAATKLGARTRADAVDEFAARARPGIRGSSEEANAVTEQTAARRNS